MNNVSVKPRRKTSRKVLWHAGDLLPRELLAFCPSCKALEIVRFAGTEMIPTRKFVQKRNRVYHACGSDTPCRLHSSMGRTRVPGGDRLGLPAFSFRLAPPGLSRPRAASIVGSAGVPGAA